MLTVRDALEFILAVEKLSPRNSATKSIKGYNVRTVILLLAILEHEGENQVFFGDKFEWTYPAVSGHTKTLLDDGFII